LTCSDVISGCNVPDQNTACHAQRRTSALQDAPSGDL
jgi:hypothetical protein